MEINNWINLRRSMKKKVGALFITYNANINQLKKNIKTVLKQVNACVIVDNGSKNIDQLVQFSRRQNITLIKLEKNYGIAAAQNQGFKYFDKHKFEWVLTLDQDSLLPDNTMYEFELTGKMNDVDTGIIAASYFDKNWTETQKRALVYQGNESVIEKKFVISSGNLVNVVAWREVRGFDERLFIDMVDYDFDARLIISGFKIWQSNLVIMEHAIGTVLHRPILERLLLLPETGLLSDHPAFRQYYIYRNTIIFYKRYPNLKKKKLLIPRSFFATRRMLVYQDSITKLKYSWKGIIDGIRYDPKKDLEFLDTLRRIEGKNEASD
ncbi:glycosyltransferase [Pediococcus acidilactici]